MTPEFFLSYFREFGCDFYTGVPDSQLSALCNHIYSQYGTGNRHIVAANEGAAVGLAAGHYLATGNPAMVYMQNSGLGNAVNPICSLLNEKVYAIPAVFVIGWRGEPGIHDEPQHIFQGAVTKDLLQCLNIPFWVLDKETSEEQMETWKDSIRGYLSQGRSIAVIVRKGAFSQSNKPDYSNEYSMSRETAVSRILECSSPDDVFVCTTGKLSREVFEYREAKGQSHKQDFLTVGSMGHSLMIALGIAMEQPYRRVFCLDGDGAMLMHMGSLVVNANHAPGNLIHVVIHNGAHESVGGMPVDSNNRSLSQIAMSCGYCHAYQVRTEDELIQLLTGSKDLNGSIFIEIFCNLSVRSDLGRPTTTPQENRDALMHFLKEKGYAGK